MKSKIQRDAETSDNRNDNLEFVVNKIEAEKLDLMKQLADKTEDYEMLVKDSEEKSIRLEEAIKELAEELEISEKKACDRFGESCGKDEVINQQKSKLLEVLERSIAA